MTLPPTRWVRRRASAPSRSLPLVADVAVNHGVAHLRDAIGNSPVLTWPLQEPRITAVARQPDAVGSHDRRQGPIGCHQRPAGPLKVYARRGRGGSSWNGRQGSAIALRRSRQPARPDASPIRRGAAAGAGVGRSARVAAKEVTPPAPQGHSRSGLAARRSPPHRSTSSTLRFFARPSSVLLVLTGAIGPTPKGIKRLGFIPWREVRIPTTASARAWESFML